MSNSATNTSRSTLDKLAVALSAICLVHCLALPVLLTLAPISGSFLIEDELFHLLMLVVIVPISLIALTIGCRQHKDTATLVLGGLGLGILVLTAFFGHDWFGETGERVVTSGAGLILAAAHIRNYLICRRVDCQHDH